MRDDAIFFLLRESIEKLLGTVTEVKFTRGHPDAYFEDDRTLDGINSIHLAGRFHAESLFVIMRFLRDEKMMYCIKRLLSQGDPHLGNTPLHESAKSPKSLSLTILLISCSNVDALNKKGYTALHVASKAGLDANCQMLLDYGANPNAIGNNEHPKTPLHAARTQKVVHLLLDHGANPYHVSKNKSVMDVLLQRNPPAVEELMNLGIETNGQAIDSADLQIIFNFEIFFHEGKLGLIERRSDKMQVNEMDAHLKIIESNHKELLKHPLAEAFLHFKWQLNKKVFLLNCVAFFTFLLMLTSMTMLEGKSFFSNKAYVMNF